MDYNLSNPGDLKSHLDYFYLLIHYSIYRKLFANEDQKLYQGIWTLQKKCPVIVVYNNLTLNAGQFLVSICPLKKKVKCDPKDIQVFQAEETKLKNARYSDEIKKQYMKLVTWIVQMNSDALKDSVTNADKEFLRIRSNLIV